ncbi:glycosyl transferase [Rhodococcoides trifolii]|uniref:Glycosyl transferase n=1 Tax=Rhodococcoides trifolii TaxID=908250 RepID=A0A917D0V9_9NOCA|nr:glycosyl transferase [Rhodococcus trifolii]
MRTGTAVSLLGAALAAVNTLTAPRVRPNPTDTSAAETITVCIPARDEERDLPLLIADLRAQRVAAPMRVLVLDDGSTDSTEAAATRAIGGDDRFTILDGGVDGQGGVGKSVACIELGRVALQGECSVLIFLDADVRLVPDALASAVTELRRGGTSLLSPWPRQDAVGLAERLVQPLLVWSWTSTLYLRGANASLRASTAVACGQFLVLDALAYRAIGGHESTRSSVTDDLTLARRFRASGFPTAVAYAGEVASCRMYTSTREVRVGYTRWLWSAFGRPAAMPPALLLAVTAWVVPPIAAVVGTGSVRRWGLLGYAAAVASRSITRRAEGLGLDVPAAATHPVSVSAGVALVVESARGRRRGTLTWKDRRLSV